MRERAPRLGVDARSSPRPPPRGSSSPSHFATTAVAIELPTALVAERPMSRKVSTPRISSRPASGMLNWLSVAAITTSEARGTPAMPFEVSIRISSIVICVPIGSSMS